MQKRRVPGPLDLLGELARRGENLPLLCFHCSPAWAVFVVCWLQARPKGRREKAATRFNEYSSRITLHRATGSGLRSQSRGGIEFMAKSPRKQTNPQTPQLTATTRDYRLPNSVDFSKRIYSPVFHLHFHLFRSCVHLPHRCNCTEPHT